MAIPGGCAVPHLFTPEEWLLINCSGLRDHEIMIDITNSITAADIQSFDAAHAVIAVLARLISSMPSEALATIQELSVKHLSNLLKIHDK